MTIRCAAPPPTAGAAAAIVLFAGFLLPQPALAAAEAGDGDSCVTRVGTCRMFSCRKGHGNVTCQHNLCTCAAGYCSYDGFFCTPRDPNHKPPPAPKFPIVLPTCVFVAVLLAIVFRADLKHSLPEVLRRRATWFVECLSRSRKVCDFVAVFASDFMIRTVQDISEGWSKWVVVISFFACMAFVWFRGLLLVLENMHTVDCVATHFPWYEDFKLWYGLLAVSLSEVKVTGVAHSGYEAMLETSFRHAVREGPQVLSHSDQIVVLFQLVLRLFGQNMVILFGAERHLNATLCTIIATNVIRGVFGWLLQPHQQHFKERWAKRHHDYLPPTHGSDSGRKWIYPKNVYLDLAQPFGHKVAVVFLGQMSLVFLYSCSIRDEVHETLCFGNWSWERWLLTMLVQFLLTSQMGSHFFTESFDWMLIFDSVDEDGNVQLTDEDEHDYAEDFRPFICIRLLMSFVANSVVFGFLVLTTPLILISSDKGFDFVKDCLAIGYIVMLDDLDDEDARKMRVKRFERHDFQALASS